MADYLSLTVQQTADPRSRGLEWTLAQAEELITRFEWKQPSDVLFDEVYLDSWAVSGIKPRHVNQGFMQLYSSGGGKAHFNVVSYGGVDVIDPKQQAIQPNHFDTMSKKAARSIAIEWANSILDPTKVGSDSESITSLPAYCANMGRTYVPAANGGALNLIYFDRMLQMTRRVSDKVFFLVGDKMMARLSQLTRNQAISGNMSMTQDAFGKPLLMYNSIPIYGAGKTVDNRERIDFNETVGTSNVTSSIYLIYTGDEGVYGLRSALTDELNTKQYVMLPNGSFAPQLIHEVQQPLGIAVATPYSIVQLRGITDSPIVDVL